MSWLKRKPRPELIARELLERRRIRPWLEVLEDRTVPTTTVFLDFGFGFPAGTLNVTNADMARADVRGPQVFPGGHSIIGILQTVQNRSIDLNTDGLFDIADANILASRITQAVQRQLAPFNIIVQQASATSIDDIAASLGANGNGVGNRDSYVIVAGQSDPGASAFGWAPLDGGNNFDNTCFAFLDQMIGSLGVNVAPTAVGRTAAHEAGHTFGLEHTNQSNLALGLLGVGDFVGSPGDNGGGDNRDFSALHIVTRFDLLLADLPAGNQNNYNILANAAVVGASPTFGAYVTGTGGWDRITVTLDANPAFANVNIQVFDSSAFTNQIANTSYQVSVANGITIDSGHKGDEVIVDARLGGLVTVRGGDDGTAGERIIIDGFNAGLNGTWTQNTATTSGLNFNSGRTFFSGSFTFGGTTINVQELKNSSQIRVRNVTSLAVNGTGGTDTFTATKISATETQVTGLIDGATLLPLIFENTGTVGLNGLGGADTFRFDNTGRVVNQAFNVAGGTGFDTLIVTGDPGFVSGREVYRAGATEDAGIYILDPNGNTGPGGFGAGSGDELVVSFTGLDPIDTDVPAANFDIVLSAAADLATLENGGILNGFNALQLTDNGATFETTRFTRKTAVIISGSTGGDNIRYNYTVASQGLISLSNFGNAAPGIPIADDGAEDIYQVLSSAAGILHFNNGNLGFDRTAHGLFDFFTFNTGIGRLDNVLGLHTVTDEDANAEYRADDSGSPAGRFYQFFDSAGDTRLTSTSLPGLNILYDGDTYLSFLMAMGNFADNINILANNAGGGNNPILSFFGNDGNDDFVVTPSTTAFINIDGGPPVDGDPGVPPGDKLTITTPGSTVFPLNSPNGTVFTPGRFNVNFVSIETLVIPDRFEVNNTPATATFLGSDPFVTLRDLSIHQVDDPLTPLVNEADVDFFRYNAHDTGYLVINAQYTSFADGQIIVEVFRPTGNGLAFALDPVVYQNNANYLASTPAAFGTIVGSRLVIPVVAQQTYFIRVRGANQQLDTNNYALELENFAAPVPTVVDLLQTSDFGRFNNDNITNDNTPTFNVQADLAFLAAQGIPILTAAQAAAGTFFGAAVEVSINVNGSGTIVNFFADPIAASGNTIFSFTPPAALPDGQHQITAAVRIFDVQANPVAPVGNGANAPRTGRELLGSPPLSFIIDTVAPAFPTLNLVNDTGVNGDPATFVDRVTRDPLSPFSGISENGSLVRLFANGIFMGDNFANITGQWYVEPQFSLNTAGLFPYDGLRNMSATAEDLAGNVSGATLLNVFIDTQGPTIASLFALDDGVPVPVDLLDPEKPSLQPTAQVDGLRINFEDLPLRIAGFLYGAINEFVGEDPLNYVVRGQKTGLVAIASVVVTNGAFPGLPGLATVDLNFFAPLQDDIYTLEISPRVTDNPGNPVPNVPGGIELQFIVDSQPELGVYAGGTINIDINGNFQDDGNNGDIRFRYTPNGAQVFAGQFTDEFGAADGFDRLGVYGRLANRRLGVQLDFDNDGTFDYTRTLTRQVNGTAIAGNFSDFKDGDEIGIFTGSVWYLDTNGNNDIDAGDTVLRGNMRGLPVVGDFDGDGLDDLATFQNNRWFFDLADNGLTGNSDRSINFGMPTRLDRPVAADWDLDGITDIGLWTPGRATTLQSAQAEWFWVVSDFTPIPDRNPNVDFRVEPFGRDFVATFGNPRALPIVGNFDPPLPGVGAGTFSSYSQASNPGFDGNTLASLGADAFFSSYSKKK